MAKKDKFDLSALLADVSGSDTDREQIDYISMDLIDDDPQNFYQLTALDELAANIAMCGLQQPIRVRQHPDTADRYMIVSGHRRRAAVKMLAQDAPERWSEIPCIIERSSGSPSLQQLRLIYANSNTRALTPSEISEQAVQVEKLLYQLQEEGYEFPGRMRDHVAKAVNASTTKLARLKVIRENLAFEWRAAFKESKLAESTAYELARMPSSWQRLIFENYGSIPRQLYEGTVKTFRSRFERVSKVRCSSSGDTVCTIQAVMMKKSCKDPYNDPCSAGCCLKCVSLQNCKTVCSGAVATQKEMKQAAKEAARRASEEAAQRELPRLEFIKGVYERVGIARTSRGVSVQALYEAQRKMYSAAIDDSKQKSLENGTAKIGLDCYLPFGYSFSEGNGSALCRVADLLDVSTDYLLGRSKAFHPVGWQTGTPQYPGKYVVRVKFDPDAPVATEDMSWDDKWFMYGKPIDESIEVMCWIAMPEETQGAEKGGEVE